MAFEARDQVSTWLIASESAMAERANVAETAQMEHISLIDNEKINAPKQNQVDTTTTMGASMSNYATDCVSKQNEGLSLDGDDDARSVGSALYPGETWETPRDATQDASRGNNIATTTDARSIRVEFRRL